MKLKAKPTSKGFPIGGFNIGEFVMCTECPNGNLNDGSAYLVTDGEFIVEVAGSMPGTVIRYDYVCIEDALFVPAELYLEEQ